MKLNSSEGRKLLVCRGPVQSPDIHILSSNSQHLEFVYSRKGQTQDYGPDRRWNNLLYAGDTAFQAGVPPLMRVLRVVEEEKMQLVDADNNLLTDVTRVVRGKGYRYPVIRHRFHWKGKAYLLEASRKFTGKNFTCKDEASGQLVLSFSDTFFKRKQIGEVIISNQVPAEDQTLLLAAWLAFYEFDGRRTLLTFGESYLVQDVVA